jgi:glutamate synthase (NADPH/NADH) large chain
VSATSTPARSAFATQNPELRARFTGKPEFVETFFEFIAQEVRELLAAAGLPLHRGGHRRGRHHRHLGGGGPLEGQRPRPGAAAQEAIPAEGTTRYQSISQDHGLEKALDHQLIALARPALDDREQARGTLAIRNVNRTVGTLLGHEVTRRHVGGLPDGSIDLTLTGSAGQSFGAFLPAGVTLRLVGDANDYVGKGLSGGRLIVTPAPESTFVAAGQCDRRQCHRLRRNHRRDLPAGHGR